MNRAGSPAADGSHDPQHAPGAVPRARGAAGARSRPAGTAYGHTLRSTAGSARSAPRMNTVSGRTAGIQ